MPLTDYKFALSLDVSYKPAFELALDLHDACRARKLQALRESTKKDHEKFLDLMTTVEDPLYEAPSTLLIRPTKLPDENLYILLINQCLKVDVVMERIEQRWVTGSANHKFTFHQILDLDKEVTAGMISACLKRPQTWEKKVFSYNDDFTKRNNVENNLTEVLLDCMAYVYPDKLKFAWKCIQKSNYKKGPLALLSTQVAKIEKIRAFIQKHIDLRDENPSHYMGQQCGPDSGPWRSDDYDDFVKMRELIDKILQKLQARSPSLHL
jgi:hypothetical protein